MPFWWLLHYVDTWQHSQLFIVVRFQQPSHLTVAGGSYCAAGLHCVTNVTSAGCAGFCQTLSSWGRGVMWEQDCALRNDQRQLANFIWSWCSCNFECDVLKLILSMWILLLFISTPPSPFSPPPSSQKDCVGHDIEMPVMRCVGISSLATALRSPNSGVKLPLLAPYFLWKQCLPHPSTCCPHCTAPSGSLSLLCVTRSG